MKCFLILFFALINSITWPAPNTTPTVVTAFTSDSTSRRCSSELFQESKPQPRSNGDLPLCPKDSFPWGFLSVPVQRDHKESGLCARGMNVCLKPGFDCLSLRRNVFEWPFFNAWLVRKNVPT